MWQQSLPRDTLKVSFLTMPAEIRIMILEAALVTTHPLARPLLMQDETGDEKPILPHAVFSPMAFNAKRGYRALSITPGNEVAPLPNLMATCRQLHAEPESMLYSNNTFMFFSNDTMSWTHLGCEGHRNVAPRYRHLVKHAFLNSDAGPFEMTQIGEMLTRWPNVSKITVRIANPDFKYDIRLRCASPVDCKYGCDRGGLDMAANRIVRACLKWKVRIPEELDIVTVMASELPGRDWAGNIIQEDAGPVENLVSYGREILKRAKATEKKSRLRMRSLEEELRLLSDDGLEPLL